MVLKPINPYQDRVLPHLIGSVEFNHDETLGLRESQSDEETEEAVSISDKVCDHMFWRDCLILFLFFYFNLKCIYSKNISVLKNIVLHNS